MTVEFLFNKRIETGFPTMFERPITVETLPSISILYSSRSLIIPLGVQGIA